MKMNRFQKEDKRNPRSVRGIGRVWIKHILETLQEKAARVRPLRTDIKRASFFFLSESQMTERSTVLK